MKLSSLPRRSLLFFVCLSLVAVLLPVPVRAGTPVTTTTRDYIIITSTEAVNRSATAFGAFIDHKRGLGFTPYVVTENDYDPQPMIGARDRPEKIRSWLKLYYQTWGIRYVLLIGNPDPLDPDLPSDGAGNVPMKMCRPASGAPYLPTDAYYADLTGNWDANNNGVACEWEDFTQPGGLDLTPEVAVGRIPVYGQDYAALSAVLNKTIQYEDALDVTWRKSALLAMSPVDDQTDGSYLGQAIQTDLLAPAEFSSFRMYPIGADLALPHSSFLGDSDLRGNFMLHDRWIASPPGISVLWGTGSTDRLQVGYPGRSDGDLLAAASTTALDNAHPAVTVLVGSDTGRPESSGSLAFSLLKTGAVGVLSSTRPVFLTSGEQNFAGSASPAGIAYEFTRQVVENQRFGSALQAARQNVQIGSGQQLANILGANLMGDPSLRLTPQTAVPAPVLSSLAPNRIRAGSAAFTLALGGSNFLTGSEVYWNGSKLASSYTSGTQLTAQVPAENIASAGSVEVWVSNPGSSAQLSQKLTFTIDPPGGSCVSAESIGLDLPRSGRNDAAGSARMIDAYPGTSWDESGPEYVYTFDAPAAGTFSAVLAGMDSDLDLFLLDGSQPCHASNLLASGDTQMSFSASAGHRYYMVVDGRSGAVGSYSLNLTCTDCSNPLPVLESLSPWNTAPQTGPLTIQIAGSGFNGASAAWWDSSILATQYIDPQHLSAEIPSNLLTAPVSAEIEVRNPTPGGGRSNRLLFSVQSDTANTCLPVSRLDPGQSISARTDSPTATDRIDAYPGVTAALTGPEIAYRFSTNAAETITLDLYNAPTSLSLFVVDGASGACRSENLVASGKKLVSFQAAANRDYYLIVDGENETAGSFTLTARCPGCQHPAPDLSALEPSVLPAGSPDFTFTVRGQDFEPGSIARWNGIALLTTFHSSSEISAVVPALLAALPGSAAVDVINPSAQRVSNGLPFALTSPTAQCFPAADIQPGQSDTRRSNALGSTRQLSTYPLRVTKRTGPEFTYRFIPEVSGMATAVLSGLSVDLDLFIIDGSSGICRPDDENILASGVTRARFPATAGTPYFIIVDGYNGVSGSYTLAVIDAARRPSNLSTAITARPVFTWPRVDGATTYLLQVSTRPDGTVPFISRSMTDPRYVPTADLPRGKTLYWRTTPITGTKRGTPSEIWSFTSANPPPAPALVSPASAALVRTLTPRLDWSTPVLPVGTQFDRYEIQIALDSYFSQVWITSSAANWSLSELTLNSPLASNRTYYWRVRAWNNTGQVSPWSAARYFRTVLPTPVLLSPTEGEAQDPDQHTFTWDSVAGASSYTLQVSYAATFRTPLFSVTVTSPRYTRILKSTRLFYWRVRANGSNGPSDWSPIRSFTDPT